MLLLGLGLCLFIGAQLFSELGLKAAICAKHSLGSYKLIHRLISLLGLIFIVWGRSNAPFITLWQPRFELQFISQIVMIPSIILVVSAYLPGSAIRQELVHPLLFATLIWSLAHLWANADLASVMLFGSFLLWSLIKLYCLFRAQINLPELNSSTVHFGWDVLAITLGFLLYGFIALYHGQLFGIGLSFAY